MEPNSENTPGPSGIVQNSQNHPNHELLMIPEEDFVQWLKFPEDSNTIGCDDCPVDLDVGKDSWDWLIHPEANNNSNNTQITSEWNASQNMYPTFSANDVDRFFTDNSLTGHPQESRVNNVTEMTCGDTANNGNYSFTNNTYMEQNSNHAGFDPMDEFFKSLFSNATENKEENITDAAKNIVPETEVKNETFTNGGCFLVSDNSSSSGYWSVPETPSIPIQSEPQNSGVVKAKISVKPGVKQHFPATVHECAQCEYKSLFKENHDEHVEKAHPISFYRLGTINAKFVCEGCEYEAPNHVEMISHQFSAHGTLNFECPTCRFRIDTVIGYIGHFVENEGHIEEWLKCETCPFKTTDPFKMLTHPRKHPRQRTRRARSATAAVRTRRTRPTTPAVRTNRTARIKPTKISSEPPYALVSKTPEGEFACGHCKDLFDDLVALLHHIDFKHKICLLQCPGCDEVRDSLMDYFRHLDALPEHIPMLRNCRYCAFKTPFLTVLNHHSKWHKLQVVHENQAKIEKEIVDINRINFSFNCNECPFDTPLYQLLVLHMFNIHKIRHFQCPECLFVGLDPKTCLDHFSENTEHIKSYMRNCKLKGRNKPPKNNSLDANYSTEVQVIGNKKTYILTPIDKRSEKSDSTPPLIELHHWETVQRSNDTV